MQNERNGLQYFEEQLKQYFSEIRNIPILSDEEELNLAILAKNGDEKAKEKLINSCLKLVVSFAKKNVGYGLDFMDLIQEGNIGLLKALEKYDPNKGYKFSTYASWWIRQCILRALANQSRTIRVPVYLNEILIKIKRYKQKYIQIHGEEPSLEALAKELNISKKKLLEINSLVPNVLSIDAPISDDNKTIGDYIPGNSFDEDEIIERVIYESLKKDTKQALEVLKENEKKVIISRYGFEDNTPKSFKYVSKDLGVSKTRAGQIGKSALEKLRLSEDITKLASYMDNEEIALKNVEKYNEEYYKNIYRISQKKRNKRKK